jgi:hypothetical protein
MTIITFPMNDEGNDTTPLEPLLPVQQQSFTINDDGDHNIDIEPLQLQNGIPNVQSHPPPPPQLQLSLSLRIGYSCIGMIMTLPNTAFLYFINTYLQVPLSLLPLYMSISFLPYSFKPSYAYISSLLLQSSFTSSFLTHQIQIICLLFMSGISYIVTAYIPSQAIVLCFILAFIRSITMAWPSFLFDLLLLDEVMVVVVSLHDDHSVSLLSNAEKRSSIHGETVATFQSQAATYRSIGCVIANILALCILTVPQWTLKHHHHNNHNSYIHTGNGETNGMSHTSFQFILIFTGILNFICAIVLWKYGDGGGSSTKRIQSENNVSSEMESDLTMHCPLLSKSDLVGEESTDTGTTPAVVVQGRTPSYDSIEDHLQHNCDLSRNTSLEIDSPYNIARLKSDEQSNNQSISSPSIPVDNHDMISHNNSKWFIVVLQITIVLFTLRESMIHIISNIGWIGITIVPIVLLIFLIRNKWKASLWNASTTTATYTPSTSFLEQQQQQQHHHMSLYQIRVGLFLILRYSIPSFTYVMNSYVYTTFETMPYLIQMLSLLDMCTTTIACWTYSKYLSRYSTGQQLLWLIAITTILAGISSLFGNVLLIHILDPQHSNYYSIPTKVLCTIGINTMIGFFNEWKFFPDVVLASVSINTINLSSSSSSSSDVQVTGNPSSTGTSNDHISDVDRNDSNNNHEQTNRLSAQQQQQQHTLSVGVQYGSLMSCIDFGDQIGTLLAGPIISLLHTSRDNHWQNLDVLQEINSILMILSIALLILLLR